MIGMKSGEMTNTQNTTSILGVRVDHIDRDAALNRIMEFIGSRNGRGARKIFFTNVHSIHLARRDEVLKSGINNADLVLPDGSGLKMAGKILAKMEFANLNGTDFTPVVLGLAQQNGWTVYLYGGEREIVAVCHRNLLQQYPRLRIVGSRKGYTQMSEQQDILDDINEKKPDILLVALGSPRQELWISRHAPDLNAGICLAVGGLFDFIAGKHSRAPQWMRSVGIEWLYRFFQDPKGKADRVFVEIPAFAVVLATRWLFSRRKDHRQ